jgi:hypothetical protein
MLIMDSTGLFLMAVTILAIVTNWVVPPRTPVQRVYEQADRWPSNPLATAVHPDNMREFVPVSFNTTSLRMFNVDLLGI